jgi:hypothetical protein
MLRLREGAGDLGVNGRGKIVALGCVANVMRRRGADRNFIDLCEKHDFSMQ